MNTDEVARACDELHEYIELGPGEDQEILGRALRTLGRLKASAPWEYPRTVLEDLETRVATWFSPAPGGGFGAEEHHRQALLEQLGELEDSWSRPRA